MLRFPFELMLSVYPFYYGGDEMFEMLGKCILLGTKLVDLWISERFNALFLGKTGDYCRFVSEL